MIQRLKAKIGSNKHVKEVVKGSAFTLLAKIFGTVLGLISSLMIARYYGANVVGLVAIINSVLSIFIIFGLMGTNVAILRFIPEYIEKYSLSDAYAIYKKILLLVFTLSFIGGILLYFSAPFIASDIFHNKDLTIFLLIAAPFILMRTLTTINSETLRGLRKIKLYALVQFLTSLINLVLLILLTYFLYDKYNPIYILFISIFLLFIVLFLMIKKQFRSTEKTISKMSTSQIVNLSFPMFLTASMQMVIVQTDTVMLGIMRTVEEVGVYAIVVKLALLTSFILTAVNSMAAPKFSQLYHSGKMEDLKIVAQKSAQLIFWSSLPLILIYILAGYYILQIFGDEFTNGYYALIFLAIGQFVNAAVGSVGYFLNMTGHQKVFKNIILFAALLNLVLNFILIPMYGITGAAIASTISMIFWNVFAAFYVKKIFGFYISYNPLLLRKTHDSRLH